MKERFKNNFGTSFESFMDDTVKEAKATATEDVKPAEEEQNEADFLLFGTGAETDDRVLNSLIAAIKEIENLKGNEVPLNEQIRDIVAKLEKEMLENKSEF